MLTILNPVYIPIEPKLRFSKSETIWNDWKYDPIKGLITPPYHGKGVSSTRELNRTVEEYNEEELEEILGYLNP